MIIESLLDTDLYKITMQQAVVHRFPQAEAEYAFKLRNKDVDLRPFAQEIADEIKHFCTLTFTPDELEYLAKIRYLKPSYVEALCRFCLDFSDVTITAEDEFRLTIKGNWFQTILFEVPVLAIINEVYFRNTHPLTDAARQEGDARLQEKCVLAREEPLLQGNLVEFGTRRRYSRTWHHHVLEVMTEQLPGILIGTSNIAEARHYGLRPFGTMAHEFLQAGQAFVALEDSQKFALEEWMQEYRGDLGIALSDVLGMDAFLRDFDLLFSKAYDGARHDSGDPYAWGEKLIAHYERMKIDPRTKTAVFSDGLDIPKARDLARHFQGRIRTMFGIGTNLTNDLGFEPLQIVIKMIRCNGRPVAKISDSQGKSMGTDTLYLDYLRQVFHLA